MNWKWKWLILVALLSAALAGCAALFEPLEQRLLFRPRPVDRERLAAMEKRLDNIEPVELAAEEGVRIRGWLQKPKGVAKFPLVIVFGGVARETSWLLNWPQKTDQWGWLIVNYRGYGTSEGAPSERALYADAKLIFDYDAARADVDATRIVVLGRSLGSAVAAQLAAERPVRSLILTTPLDSLASIGNRRFPFLPVVVIAGGHYDIAALAPRIFRPALFVIAEEDDVTPPEHGERLAGLWAGEKKIVRIPGAGHRMVEWRAEYWAAVNAWLSAQR
ncbi:MAG: alpha/beta fold hydrolase [Betaproteobacteria bacterium]|nr:alpha/beta fold hydrolase [Betaproteobacteria bacterium]